MTSTPVSFLLWLPFCPPPPPSAALIVPRPSAGATTDNLPPGVLYRVKAAYKYQAEDADELSFEVAECIQVVEYDDQEEQVGTAGCGEWRFRSPSVISSTTVNRSTI